MFDFELDKESARIVLELLEKRGSKEAKAFLEMENGDLENYQILIQMLQYGQEKGFEALDEVLGELEHIDIMVADYEHGDEDDDFGYDTPDFYGEASNVYFALSKYDRLVEGALIAYLMNGQPEAVIKEMKLKTMFV